MSEIPDGVSDPLEVPKGETLPSHAIHFYTLEILRGTHPSPLTLEKNIDAYFVPSHWMLKPKGRLNAQFRQM